MGGDSYTFTLPIQDTATLLDLLECHRNLIQEKARIASPHTGGA